MNFELKYINIGASFYEQAIKLRTDLFFKNLENSHDLVQDDFEQKGIHLVCLNKNEVVGVGRLNIENKVGIISQMAIKECYQKTGIGSKILKELIAKSIENKVTKIELSARESAIIFYEKFNFRAFGNTFPSIKTGIIHQKMVLKIQ